MYFFIGDNWEEGLIISGYNKGNLKTSRRMLSMLQINKADSRFVIRGQTRSTWYEVVPGSSICTKPVEYEGTTPINGTTIPNHTQNSGF